MQGKSIIVGCVRNAGPYLKHALHNANILKSHLHSQHPILIAYDDSVDDSLQILDESPNVVVLRTADRHLHPIRTVRLASARNRLLEYVERHYSTVDYVFVMDPDDRCAPKIQLGSLNKILTRLDDWDVVSFNRQGYYDWWALSIGPYKASCWHFEKPYEVMDQMSEYLQDQFKTSDLVECDSAFGGFAIYKWPFLKGLRYTGDFDLSIVSPEDLANQCRIVKQDFIYQNPVDRAARQSDCEHRALHHQIRSRGGRIRISRESLFDATNSELDYNFAIVTILLGFAFLLVIYCFLIVHSTNRVHGGGGYQRQEIMQSL